MYKIAKSIVSTEPSSMIIRLSDNAYIPMVESNADYKKYLEWVAEGNTPEPADE
jgi:hypothetical protein